ncbi:hypothetical protein D3C73_1552800 [compost metagenome]
MGSKAYKNNAKIAGFGPIPKKGIRIPNRAILGIVCKMPVKPINGPDNPGFLAIKIPNGTATKIAAIKEIRVRPMCVAV